MYHFVTIFRQYLEGHSVPHVIGNSYPPSGLFFGGWKSFSGIQIEDGFIETIFKKRRDVLESAMSYFSWYTIANGLVGAHTVNIRNVFTSQEPAILGSTGSIQQDLGMVLNELDCTKLCQVLLGMPGLGKLIHDKIFPIETGCPLS
jgi:hypothetical protein